MTLPLDPTEAKSKLLKLFSRSRSAFEQRNTAIKDFDALYYMTHNEGRRPKPGEEIYTSNKSTNIVDLGVGILTLNPMRIRSYRIHETEESEGEGTETEKFLRGCMYINNERNETDIEASVVFDQLRTGWAVIRTYWDSEVRGFEDIDEFGMPSRIYEELPVNIEVVPARDIYYELGGPRKYRYIIHSYRRTVQDIEDEWSIRLDKYPDNKDLTEIDYIDYWGWARIEVPDIDDFGEAIETDSPSYQWFVENAIIAGNDWVKEPEIMEGYEDLPYTIIPGRLTTHNKHDLSGLSILFPVKEQIQDYEALVTRHRRLVDLYAALPPVLEIQPGREPPIVSNELGAVVTLYEGEKFFFPQWPGTPPDFQAALMNVEQSIQEGSFPNVAYGEGPGASSGYGISLLSEAGRTRLYQYQRNLEQGWAVVFRKILSLASNFASRDRLQVYGRLGGDPYALNITGGKMTSFRVDVSIKANFPQDEMRRTTQAAQLKAQNLLPIKYIQEHYLDIDSPDDVFRTMLLEAALQDPMLMKMKVTEALQRWSPRLAQAAEMGEQQQQQGQGMDPRTKMQNAEAEAMSGHMVEPPPTMPEGSMPDRGIMPGEEVGMMPPQAMGGAPPGQEMGDPMMAMLMNLLTGQGGM